MIRLVASELRRVVQRPLTRLLVLAALGGLLVTGVVVFLSSADTTEEALRAEHRAITQQCRQDPPPMLDEVPRPEVPHACDDLAAIEVEDPRFHLVDADEVLMGATVAGALLAWLIGASLIGADWQSRALTTLLTWEPRRLRVIAAKVVALVIFITALSIGALALAGVAVLPAATFHGTTRGIDASWWWSMGSLLVRGTVLSILAAVLAFSIAAIGRTTAAALSIGFAILLVENIAGGLLPEWRRFTVLGNSIVFVVGKDNSGEVLNRSYHSAAVILTLLATVGLLAAVTSFRRQEVG